MTTFQTTLHREGSTSQAFSQGNSSQDPFEEWRFTSLYRDRGLPLDRSTVLPLVQASLSLLLPPVEEPALPHLPRHAAATVEIQDLDVTAPDLESLGGVDARACVAGLSSSGQDLVARLQQQGHVLLGLQALARLEAPLATLLLGTDPELQESTLQV